MKRYNIYFENKLVVKIIGKLIFNQIDNIIEILDKNDKCISIIPKEYLIVEDFIYSKNNNLEN